MVEPPWRIGPFAKLAFVIPAALLLSGIGLLADLPALCPPGPRCSNDPNSSCPLSAAAVQSCPPLSEGITLLVLGILALPLATLFYRSRRYLPIG